MIAPRLAQAVRAVITMQPDLSTNSSDKLPRLPPLDRLSVVVGLGIEEDKMFRGTCDGWMGTQVFGERLADTLVHDHLMTFAPLLLANPEAMPNTLLLVQEIADTQPQHVRDPQRSVDTDHKQQQVAKAPLPS